MESLKIIYFLKKSWKYIGWKNNVTQQRCVCARARECVCVGLRSVAVVDRHQSQTQVVVAVRLVAGKFTFKKYKYFSCPLIS